MIAATPDEVTEALSFGLRYSGRKRIHMGDELMARVMANHLFAYLERANFVIMRKPPSSGFHPSVEGPVSLPKSELEGS